MANEIQSVEDAEERLREYFTPGPTDDAKKLRLRSEADLKDYARIAHFLSNQRTVKPALERVSAGIWDEYRAESMETCPNRFSQSIVRYAAANFGFASQGNVAFIGPLTGRTFMSYVRDGVLWKDTFAPGHGEFSHSFQWLAAGLELKLGTRTAYLYKNSSNVFSNRMLKSRDTSNDQLGEAVQPLWAWLVDCFIPGTEPEKAASEATDCAYSKSCRVPNVMNNLAGGQHGWFINLYVAHRRDWLKKIATAGMGMRERDGETRDAGSRLEGIIKYQGKSYGDNWHWERNKDENVMLKTVVQKADKTLREAVFHGQPGRLSNKALDQKQMIS